MPVIMRHFFNCMRTAELYKLFLDSEGVATDTRIVKPGQLFFALRGESFDGNTFAAQALKSGASVAVIDDPRFETENTFLVDDCLSELQTLATRYRKSFYIPVLAITGTNGKTTTKELISTVLSESFKVHYTRGNQNNHIGVPLTILSAPPDTNMLIVEMGANHPGEIARLCEIAQPDHGIITNIGTAHLEGFGSFEGVVKTKTELYEHLRKVNGIALYNDSNTLLRNKIYALVNRAVPFSYPTGSELRVEELYEGLNLGAAVNHRHRTWTINTNLFGSYNLDNIKAAIATGLFFGVPVEKIKTAIENYVPSNNRSQVKITQRNILICDSYNANPSSMQASLESFARVKADSKAVILGDMLELGQNTDAEHMLLINRAKAIGATDIYLVGKIFSRLAISGGLNVFIDSAALGVYLKNNPLEGRTVLIKGSRGVGLEKVYDLL
jgi:UDP-N-acetylmuramoyl-tripeptide--D-alanyl-D-alanine ligase